MHAHTHTHAEAERQRFSNVSHVNSLCGSAEAISKHWEAVVESRDYAQCALLIGDWSPCDQSTRSKSLLFGDSRTRDLSGRSVPLLIGQFSSMAGIWHVKGAQQKTEAFDDLKIVVSEIAIFDLKR